MPKISHNWAPITDLPDDWPTLTTDRLMHLAETWREQKSGLNQGAISQLTSRLQRQWAIETGLIENLYTLDRGITYTLIEHGLDAIDIPHGATNKPAMYVKRLIEDQKNVIEGLFSFVKGERSLSTSYIKEIHAELTRSQSTVEAVNNFGHFFDVKLERGVWKKHPNNPNRNEFVHEYCPPEHVASEMDNLIALHSKQEKLGVPPEIEAAWLHHRFTQIHPFQDGNGRVARALATLVFLKNDWFPLVVLNDDRQTYIQALEDADCGNLRSLVAFFSVLAERSFLKALAATEYIVSHQRTEDAVFIAIQKTMQLQSSIVEKRENLSINLANQLHDESLKMFRSTRDKLLSISSPDHVVSFDVQESTNDTNHYFRSQIYSISDKFDYYVNIEKYHSWIRLRLNNARKCSIILSCHSAERVFSGVMAATVFLEYREQQDGYTQVDGPYSLCQTPFVFTGKDSLQAILPTFLEWLNGSILQGLILWQQKL